MTPVTTTYTTTPKDVIRSYRAIARRAYLTRAVGSAVVVAVGLITRDLLFVVLGVAWYVLAELWVRRQLAQYLKGPRTFTVTMTEDEYQVQGPDAASARQWTMFESVRRVQDFWVLRISAAQGMALPVDALDADQTARFRDLLARKGLLHE
jgi:YcxB-like protein